MKKRDKHLFPKKRIGPNPQKKVKKNGLEAREGEGEGLLGVKETAPKEKKNRNL